MRPIAVFLSPSKQTRELYLDWTRAVYFQMHASSSFVCPQSPFDPTYQKCHLFPVWSIFVWLKTDLKLDGVVWTGVIWLRIATRE
jgi:hypothetical protein